MFFPFQEFTKDRCPLINIAGTSPANHEYIDTYIFGDGRFPIGMFVDPGVYASKPQAGLEAVKNDEMAVLVVFLL